MFVTHPDIRTRWRSTVRLRDRFDALSGRIADAYAGVEPEEGLAEIDAAVAAERARR